MPLLPENLVAVIDRLSYSNLVDVNAILSYGGDVAFECFRALAACAAEIVEIVVVACSVMEQSNFVVVVVVSDR